MPTIAFVSPKGGAGKTTAALLLALELQARGHRVGMVDADPNKPLLHWANLPGRPDEISVHPAPTAQDVSAALREARGRRADWIILDTEGSLRGGSVFPLVRPDLVITPLASSQIEALQALRAAEMVNGPGRLVRRTVPHRALLTRLPAAVRPRSLKPIIAQLQEHGLALLPTALIEKEAFRLLFSLGGNLAGLERHDAPGLAAARANASTYAEAVLSMLQQEPA